jgi:hypothetical protein
MGRAVSVAKRQFELDPALRLAELGTPAASFLIVRASATAALNERVNEPLALAADVAGRAPAGVLDSLLTADVGRIGLNGLALAAERLRALREGVAALRFIIFSVRVGPPKPGKGRP